MSISLESSEINQDNIPALGAIFSFANETFLKVKSFKENKELIWYRVKMLIEKEAIVKIRDVEQLNIHLKELAKYKEYEEEKIPQIAQLAYGGNLRSSKVHAAMTNWMEEKYKLEFDKAVYILTKVNYFINIFIDITLSHHTCLTSNETVEERKKRIEKHLNGIITIMHLYDIFLKAIKRRGDYVANFNLTEAIKSVMGTSSTMKKIRTDFKKINDFFLINLAKVMSDFKLTEHEKAKAIFDISKFKYKLFGDVLFQEERKIELFKMFLLLQNLYSNKYKYCLATEVNNLDKALAILLKDKGYNKKYDKLLDFIKDKSNELKLPYEKGQIKAPFIAFWDGYYNGNNGFYRDSIYNCPLSNSKWNSYVIIQKMKPFYAMFEELAQVIAKVSKLETLKKKIVKKSINVSKNIPSVEKENNKAGTSFGFNTNNNLIVPSAKASWLSKPAQPFNTYLFNKRKKLRK